MSHKRNPLTLRARDPATGRSVTLEELAAGGQVILLPPGFENEGIRQERQRLSRRRFERFAQSLKRSGGDRGGRRRTILTSNEGAPFENLQLGGRTILG